MGGAASGRKGSAYERELVNRFDAAGWGALRLPSSGSATDRDLPDVLAGRPVVYPYGPHDKIVIENRSHVDGERFATEAWAIELKSGKATTLYVTEKEVDDLLAFAETWGAQAYLGARFTFTEGEHYNRTGTYLVEPEAARRTDGGAYGLPIADDGGDIDERAFAVVSDDRVKRHG